MKINSLLIAFFTIFLSGCGESPVQESVESEQNESNKEIVVHLSLEQIKTLDIKLETVKEEISDYSLTVPATVFPAYNNINKISSSINGRIKKIYRFEGDIISAGAVLMEIESLEFAELVANWFKSLTEVEYLKKKLDRAQKLFEGNVSSESKLEEVRAEFDRAVMSELAYKTVLLSTGITEYDIEQLKTTKQPIPILKVYSPISGIITESSVNPGQAVHAYDELATVLNLSSVLVRGYISPDDASNIYTGAKVSIFTKDNPNRSINSTISSINPALDAQNKSVSINVIAATENQWPKPGQNLRMEIFLKTKEPVINIPSSSVDYQSNKNFVYIMLNDSTFIQKEVKISFASNKSLIIGSGIKAGDKIAVSNIFDLKALANYEEFAEE